MPTKVHVVKVMVSPVIMYRCKSWTIKKTEHQRIDAFELWCWRKLLRVTWTARRSNQSILKEVNLAYLLEGLMLKLQYFDHLMWRFIEKDLDAGKDWGQKMNGTTEDEMVGWHHRLNRHEFGQTLWDSEGQEQNMAVELPVATALFCLAVLGTAVALKHVLVFLVCSISLSFTESVWSEAEVEISPSVIQVWRSWSFTLLFLACQEELLLARVFLSASD